MRYTALLLVGLLCAAALTPVASAAGGVPQYEAVCNSTISQIICIILSPTCDRPILTFVCDPSGICAIDTLENTVCTDFLQLCRSEPSATACALLASICTTDPSKPVCDQAGGVCTTSAVAHLCDPSDELCAYKPIPGVCHGGMVIHCTEGEVCYVLFVLPWEILGLCEPVRMPNCEEECPPVGPLERPCYPVCRPFDQGALLSPSRLMRECLPIIPPPI